MLRGGGEGVKLMSVSKWCYFYTKLWTSSLQSVNYTGLSRDVHFAPKQAKAELWSGFLSLKRCCDLIGPETRLCVLQLWPSHYPSTRVHVRNSTSLNAGSQWHFNPCSIATTSSSSVLTFPSLSCLQCNFLILSSWDGKSRWKKMTVISRKSYWIWRKK